MPRSKILVALAAIILSIVIAYYTGYIYGTDIFLQNFLSEIAGILISIAFTLIIIDRIEARDTKRFWSGVRDITYRNIVFHMCHFILEFISIKPLPKDEIENSEKILRNPFRSDKNTIIDTLDQIAMVWLSYYIKVEESINASTRRFSRENIPHGIIISYGGPPIDIDIDEVLNLADSAVSGYKSGIKHIEIIQQSIPRLERSDSNPKLITSLIKLSNCSNTLLSNIDLYKYFRNIPKRYPDKHYNADELKQFNTMISSNYTSEIFLSVYWSITVSKDVLSEILDN